MNMAEYNEALAKMEPAYQRALRTKEENDIADLILAIALNGLVVAPLIIGRPIPVPICGFINMPEVDGKMAFSIIYPANQHDQ